jgi:hypothetical protein
LLRDSKAVEAELTFGRGLEIAERGDVDYGMFWMLEALKRAQADRTALPTWFAGISRAGAN